MPLLPLEVFYVPQIHAHQKHLQNMPAIVFRHLGLCFCRLLLGQLKEQCKGFLSNPLDAKRNEEACFETTGIFIKLRFQRPAVVLNEILHFPDVLHELH